MVHRVVAPSVADVAPPVVVVAIVGLWSALPLRPYPYPTLLVSALLAPAPPSLAPPTAALGLCLAPLD